jgi:hypothetical protein
MEVVRISILNRQLNSRISEREMREMLLFFAWYI